MAHYFVLGFVKCLQVRRINGKLNEVGVQYRLHVRGTGYNHLVLAQCLLSLLAVGDVSLLPCVRIDIAIFVFRSRQEQVGRHDTGEFGTFS